MTNMSFGVLLLFLFTCFLLWEWSTRARAMRRNPEQFPPVIYGREQRPRRIVISLLLLAILWVLAMGLAGTELSGDRPAGMFSWQASVPDWIVTGQAMVIVHAVAIGFAIGPETQRGTLIERWLGRRRLVRKFHQQRLEAIFSGSTHTRHNALKHLNGKSFLMDEDVTLILMILQGDVPDRPLRLPGRRKLYRELEQRIRDEETPPNYISHSFAYTAVHEAGHTVASAAVGKTVLRCSVFSAGHGETTAAWPEMAGTDNSALDTWARQTWASLIQVEAGERAERTERTEACPGSHSDWVKALGLAHDLYKNSATLDGEKPESVLEWMRAAADEADQLLQANTAAMGNVRETLKRQRSGNSADLGHADLLPLLADIVPWSLDRVSTISAARREELRKWEEGRISRQSW